MTITATRRLIATTIGLALIPAMALAHGDDDTSHQTQSFDFTGFEKISVSGVYDLDVTVGEDYGIAISGHENEMENVKVYEEDGTLHLGKKKKKQSYRKAHGIEATITLPSLSALRVSGVAEGDVTGIDAEDFDLSVSGVGEVQLSGRCDHMTARVSGVGEIQAKELECKDVHVTLSGVGEAEVYASSSIDVKASGVGEVDVYGKPDSVKKSKGFMSSVNIR